MVILFRGILLMLPRTLSTLAGLALALILVGACSEKSTPPTPTPPAPLHAAIVVSSISVTGERAAAGGYTYRAVLHLRETGGAAATISAVDLTFVNDSGTVASARFDQAIPATANTCPANGTADTREFVTTDTNAAHAFAQSVRATVTYSDAAATAGTATGSANIPALPPLPGPPPNTFTLTGAITDTATGAGIKGARVEALNGANAGKAVTTDASGAYTLTGLVAETFRMRASAPGYDTGEQNVTIPDVPRADMALRQTGGPCVYTVSLTGTLDVVQAGTQSSLTISRPSGTCGWTATSDASWIVLASSSGDGNATLGFTVRPNTTFVGRTGTITIDWGAGRSQLTVRQAADIPTSCVVSVTVGGQNILSVPAAGGPYTANITPVDGMPPGLCSNWTASSAFTAITLNPPTSGPVLPATVTFSVAANGTGTSRALSVTVSAGGPPVSLNISQAP
jgi:hypothetical protein